MKSLPSGLPSFIELYIPIRHAVAYYILRAALKSNIFDELTEYREAEYISKALDIHPATSPLLLDALVILGLVKKSGASYRNTKKAQELLSRNSPYNCRKIIEEPGDMLLPSMERLLDILRTGPSIDMQTASSDEVWAENTRSGAVWAFHGAGEQMAEIIAGLPGAESFEQLLDLGGGHGVLSLYALERLPKLHATVFDQPAVLEVAREFVESYEAGKRIALLPGNYATDVIGEAYDVVLASHTLNFTKPTNSLAAIIKKIYTALKPGGYFISLHNAALGSEPWKESSNIEFAAYTLMAGVPLMFEEGEIADAALEVGFKHVRSRILSTDMGASVLDIAKK